MMTSKATFVVASALAAAAFGLAACGKSSSQSGSSPQAAATSAQGAAAAVTADLGEPPVPDRERTDAEAVAMRDAYVKWVVEKAHPAGLQRPVPPDPSRTDAEAKTLWAKYSLWRVAENEIDSNAALKRMEQNLGRDKTAPAQQSKYGKMADGLPQAEKK